MWKKIDSSEKKVMLVAIVLSALHLGLIAYAAFQLGIKVPFCDPDVKPFTQGKLIKHADKQFEVQIVASMWKFEPAVIKIPTGSTLQMYLSSVDVNHGLHVNQTNINMMAVPGAVNAATHTFSKPGRYHIICHEYCGVGHQNMAGWIEVGDEFTGETEGLNPSGLAEGDSSETPNMPQSLGAQLYASKACQGCHGADLGGIPGAGPKLRGLFGRMETEVGGAQVEVTEAYLKESITDPKKFVVQGFSPIMPMMPLTDEELQSLVDFIKAAK